MSSTSARLRPSGTRPGARSCSVSISIFYISPSREIKGAADATAWRLPNCRCRRRERAPNPADRSPAGSCPSRSRARCDRSARTAACHSCWPPRQAALVVVAGRVSRPGAVPAWGQARRQAGPAAASPAQEAESFDARAHDVVRADDGGDHLAGQRQPLLPPLPHPLPASRGQRHAVQRDRAARPAHYPGHIRIPQQQAGEVRVGQPDGDILSRPHQVRYQAAHLVRAAEVKPLHPDGAEQVAAQSPSATPSLTASA